MADVDDFDHHTGSETNDQDVATNDQLSQSDDEDVTTASDSDLLLSDKIIRIPRDGFGWKNQQDTIESRELLRSKVEGYYTSKLRGVPARLAKLDGSAVTDHNLDSDRIRLHYLLCFHLLCTFPAEYEAFVPLAELDRAGVFTLQKKWYLADAIQGLFVNRVREFVTGRMEESRTLTRKTTSARGTAVGDTDIATDSLDSDYMDRLAEVADSMDRASSAFSAYLHMLKQIVAKTENLSLVAFRHACTIDYSYITHADKANIAAKFTRQIDRNQFLRQSFEGMGALFGTEGGHIFEGLGRLLAVSSFKLSDARNGLSSERLGFFDLVKATQPLFDTTLQRHVRLGVDAGPPLDILEDVLRPYLRTFDPLSLPRAINYFSRRRVLG